MEKLFFISSCFSVKNILYIFIKYIVLLLYDYIIMIKNGFFEVIKIYIIKYFIK